MKEHQIESEKALSDPEKYVTNPFSSFSLIRRLGSDWKDLIQYIETDNGVQLLTSLKAFTIQSKLPTSEDVSEAVQGIVRIQRTYGLNPKDCMKGVINQVEYE